jgi:hypothetical protein
MMPRFSAERFGRFTRNAGLREAFFKGEGFDSSLIDSLDFGRLPKVSGKNPLVANLMEVINQPVYDSASFAQASTMAKTVLFQTPIGQGGKTLAQTYMTKAGQLEQPQKLVIRAISLWLANNTAPIDMINFLTNNSFTLTVGKKPMLECFCGNLTAGRGLVTYAAAELGTLATGDVQFVSTSNGVADPRTVFTLNQPIVIEGGEGFSVTVNPETAWSFSATAARPNGVGTTFYVILDGELYRGVQ